jgi:transcriptional regulator with XRE-family HTH domain
LNSSLIPGTGDGGPSDKSELSIKLDKLFNTMRKPHEPPMSNATAAEAITAKTGVSISPAYVWQLRTGMKTNPTVTHLRAIADFFGVSPSYLLDPDDNPAIDAQLSLLQAMRDCGVRDLALRASGLSAQGLSSLAVMVDHVRQLERLPPIAPTTHSATDDNLQR